MVSKRMFVLSCHGLIWACAALAFWAVGAGAAARYDTATPYTPPYTKHKYIPIHSRFDRYDAEDHLVPESPATEELPSSSGMAPSEFILTALRTLLNVVRTVNKKRANTKILPVTNSTAVAVRRSRPSNGTGTGTEPAEGARGFADYYDEHEYHDTTTTTTAKPAKQGRYTDPWAGYYDWIINEGSFKFWSVFQLFTAALLLYACISAIYYAKFNPIIPDYDREYDDYFLERSVGRNTRSLDSWELPSGTSWINPRTFQFILDAIAKDYESK